MRTLAVILAAQMAISGAAQAAGGMPGTDLLDALVGNTLVFPDPAQPGREVAAYILPDGTGRTATRTGAAASASKPASWANLSDGMFCIHEPDARPWDGYCSAITVAGDGATLAWKEGPAASGRILAGDAWTLAGQGDALTGEAAIGPLVGNTLAFIPTGGGREHTALYLLPDGGLRIARQDVKNDDPDFSDWEIQGDGRWSLQDDGRLCMTISTDPTAPQSCGAISTANGFATFRYDSGRAVHARVLAGDARHLSLAAVAAVKTIADALAGNTLVVERPDQPGRDAVLYLLADGSGRSLIPGNGAATPARWLLRPDGTLCVTGAAAKFHESDCGAVSIMGDAVTLTAQGRPTLSGRILKGNARNL